MNVPSFLNTLSWVILSHIFCNNPATKLSFHKYLHTTNDSMYTKFVFVKDYKFFSDSLGIWISLGFTSVFLDWMSRLFVCFQLQEVEVRFLSGAKTATDAVSSSSSSSSSHQTFYVLCWIGSVSFLQTRVAGHTSSHCTHSHTNIIINNNNQQHSTTQQFRFTGTLKPKSACGKFVTKYLLFSL